MESIKYQPSSKMARIFVAVKGKRKKIKAGDVINRGDIPDDAFYCFARRADFEDVSMDEYADIPDEILED